MKNSPLVNRRNLTFQSKMKDISILSLAITLFLVMGYTTTKYLLVEVDDGVVKDADRSTGIEIYIN